MARSNIPKFGNWDSANDVPYTVYFDKARKSKGEKMISPYDLQQNPDVNHDIAPAAAPQRQPVTKPEEFSCRSAMRLSSEHSMNQENIQYIQFSNPQPRVVNVPRELSYGHHGQRPSGSERLAGAGDDRGFERAPLHLQQHVKEVRATRSPIWEDMKYRNAPVAPAAARPRQRNVPPRNESPGRVATVPMFGDWNENDQRRRITSPVDLIECARKGTRHLHRRRTPQDISLIHLTSHNRLKSRRAASHGKEESFLFSPSSRPP